MFLYHVCKHCAARVHITALPLNVVTDINSTHRIKLRKCPIITLGALASTVNNQNWKCNDRKSRFLK